MKILWEIGLTQRTVIINLNTKQSQLELNRAPSEKIEVNSYRTAGRVKLDYPIWFRIEVSVNHCVSFFSGMHTIRRLSADSSAWFRATRLYPIRSWVLVGMKLILLPDSALFKGLPLNVSCSVRIWVGFSLFCVEFRLSRFLILFLLYFFLFKIYRFED